MEWQKGHYPKYAPSLVILNFFQYFGRFMTTTPVNIFPFSRELFIEPFSDTFVWTKALLTKCVTHRCKHVVIGRSQVWWISHMGYSFQLSVSYLLRTGFAVCDGTLLWRKYDFVMPRSAFRKFVKHQSSNWLHVVVSIVSLGFNSS